VKRTAVRPRIGMAAGKQLRGVLELQSIFGISRQPGVEVVGVVGVELSLNDTLWRWE